MAGDIKRLPCFLFLVINHSWKNRILPLCQVIHGNLITQFEFELCSFVPSMRYQWLCIRWTPEQWAKKVSVLFTVVVEASFHSSYPGRHAFFQSDKLMPNWCSKCLYHKIITCHPSCEKTNVLCDGKKMCHTALIQKFVLEVQQCIHYSHIRFHNHLHSTNSNTMLKNTRNWIQHPGRLIAHVFLSHKHNPSQIPKLTITQHDKVVECKVFMYVPGLSSV